MKSSDETKFSTPTVKNTSRIYVIEGIVKLSALAIPLSDPKTINQNPRLELIQTAVVVLQNVT